MKPASGPRIDDGRGRGARETPDGASAHGAPASWAARAIAGIALGTAFYAALWWAAWPGPAAPGCTAARADREACVTWKRF